MFLQIDIVTGSVRARLRGGTWPGTGRTVIVRMYGMSMREQLGRVDGELFLDRLVGGAPLGLPEEAPNVRGYVELAMRSGFPEAMALPADLRTRWLSSYLDEVVTREPRRSARPGTQRA
jgi:predicted AAA+ superfamily ATPase